MAGNQFVSDKDISMDERSLSSADEEHDSLQAVEAVPTPTDSPQSVFHAVTEPIKRVLHSRGTRTAAVSSAVLGVLVCLSLFAAVVAYVCFYQVYIPQKGFEREVLLQYGLGKPPFAQVDLSTASITSEQIYDVVLEVVAPASPNNVQLGNFMVTLDIQDPTGKTVIQATRPASLIYVPPLIHLVQTFLRLPLTLLGFRRWSTDQHISVPLVTRKAIRTYTTGAIASAIVFIGRLDAYAPTAAVPTEGTVCHDSRAMVVPQRACAGMPELQVYSAKLRFTAHLQGIRWLMYHHRVISFLLFSGIFFGITLSTAIFFWAILALRKAMSSSDIPKSTAADDTKQSEIDSGSSPVYGLKREASERTSSSARGVLPRVPSIRRRRSSDRDTGTVLGHIPLGSSAEESEGEAVDDKSGITRVKVEDEDTEGARDDVSSKTTSDSVPGSTSAWQDITEEVEEEKLVLPMKKDPENADAQTGGDTSTYAASTRPSTSYAPSLISTAATTMSRGTVPSLRQRASQASLRLQRTKSEDA